MFEILYSKIDYDILDQPSCDEMETMRKDFSVFNIQNLKTHRPLLTTETHFQLFTFTGTRINRTLQLLLNLAGLKNSLDDSSSSFDVEVSKEEFFAKWTSLSQPSTEIDTHITNLLQATPTLLDFSKWGLYLPQKFQVKLINDKYFDIANTEKFLSSIKFIENKE